MYKGLGFGGKFRTALNPKEGGIILVGFRVWGFGFGVQRLWILGGGWGEIRDSPKPPKP